MAAVPESSWGNSNSNSASSSSNPATTVAAAASSVLGFVTGHTNNNSHHNSSSHHQSAAADGSSSKDALHAPQQQQQQNQIQPQHPGQVLTANAASSSSAASDPHAWIKGGRSFASHREVYTRSLFRLCLKFTTSEDEDEGKPEPATAFWTLYGRTTTIGNAGPNSPTPDNICRRMDDSMTGPAAGVLSRLTDLEGDTAAAIALASGMTTGWQIRGDRGDAAVRVGKARVFVTGGGSGGNNNGKPNPKENSNPGGDGAGTAPGREAQVLSLDAERWVLCKGASFAAGNSVFTVEDWQESKQKITVHCAKGPLRGKLIDVHASRCPFVFGRAHEADLCIMDRELSRRHGAILYIPPQPSKATGGKGGMGSRNRNPPTPNPHGSFVLVDLESTVRFHHLKE